MIGAVNNALMEMQGALVARSLYPMGHPRIETCEQRAGAMLREVLDVHPGPELAPVPQGPAQPEPGRFYLFSYFEYHGEDFEADMAKMAADTTTQKWWTHCKPCQQPVPTRAEGEWWAALEEVFHCD